MNLFGILAAAVLTATPSILTPAIGQSYNFLETQDEAARRRQAEQYYYEKEQQRRGNTLNIEKPRGLGEAPPSHLSNPRGQSDSYNPTLPRECPPNQMMCR